MGRRRGDWAFPTTKGEQRWEGTNSAKTKGKSVDSSSEQWANTQWQPNFAAKAELPWDWGDGEPLAS